MIESFQPGGQTTSPLLISQRPPIGSNDSSWASAFYNKAEARSLFTSNYVSSALTFRATNANLAVIQYAAPLRNHADSQLVLGGASGDPNIHTWLYTKKTRCLVVQLSSST
jgi:hypothetical protein